MGAEALPHSSGHTGRAWPHEVLLWFPLTPRPRPRRCLIERPRTERLLAIQGGGSQGLDSRAQEASGGRCWRPSAWVGSSQAESLIYLVQKL